MHKATAALIIGLLIVDTLLISVIALKMGRRIHLTLTQESCYRATPDSNTILD